MSNFQNVNGHVDRVSLKLGQTSNSVTPPDGPESLFSVCLKTVLEWGIGPREVSLSPLETLNLHIWRERVVLPNFSGRHFLLFRNLPQFPHNSLRTL